MHGQVQLDIHTLERLFGQQLRALSQECIEVVSRDIVNKFVFDLLYMVGTQSKLTKVGPPSLQFSLLKRGTFLKGFHRLLITQLHDRVTPKEARLGREHAHPSQDFLVIGAIVGSCLIPLPVPVSHGH